VRSNSNIKNTDNLGGKTVAVVDDTLARLMR